MYEIHFELNDDWYQRKCNEFCSSGNQFSFSMNNSIQNCVSSKELWRTQWNWNMQETWFLYKQKPMRGQTSWQSARAYVDQVRSVWVHAFRVYTCPLCMCPYVFKLAAPLTHRCALSWPTNTSTSRRAIRQRDSRTRAESRLCKARRRKWREFENKKIKVISSVCLLLVRSLSIVRLSWRRISLHVRVYRLLDKSNMFGYWIKFVAVLISYIWCVQAFLFAVFLINNFISFQIAQANRMICVQFRNISGLVTVSQFIYSFFFVSLKLKCFHFYRALIMRAA